MNQFPEARKKKGKRKKKIQQHTNKSAWQNKTNKPPRAKPKNKLEKNICKLSRALTIDKTKTIKSAEQGKNRQGNTNSS